MRALVFALSVSLTLAFTLSGCSYFKRGADANASPDNTAQVTTDGAANSQPGATTATNAGGDAQAHFQRGMEAYRDDRDDEAVEAFKEAVRLDPDFAEAHYRLGLAYAVVGQEEESEKSFETAAKLYEKILDKEPKNSDAQFFLGLTYGKLGKYDQSVKFFKEAVRNSPEEDDDKYYELGLAHYKLAQYKEAITAFNKALEINPDYFPASDALEKAKPGLARREAFLKNLEKQRKSQEQRGNTNGNINANVNGNSNSSPRPSAPAPTPAPALSQ
ncbi:MAG TPA: tetratricopeptide repeat protein [Pyrinomonadaceae bacterium]|nr:tetratricopeptide repeat protein [Pyrinomonadaceae bacterium]